MMPTRAIRVPTATTAKKAFMAMIKTERYPSTAVLKFKWFITYCFIG
jgi:hypothetical protein